jgi:glycosyltransferase involved in cell wall biosynthesis
MRTGLAERGVDPNKIFVLPHSVDVTRFRPKGGVPKYDLISIGQLIERKRMDVLIDALGIVARRGHRLRLGIVGRGNQEQSLREQVARLGLSEQVDFLGYRNDVEEVVRDARVFCLASAWEGVPFAMMEAMASGLVPVVTDVGTITDWVRDGENGRIVPVGNAAALADVLHELFVTEPETLERLATSVRDAQRELGFEQGAAVWRQVLELDGPRT